MFPECSGGGAPGQGQPADQDRNGVAGGVISLRMSIMKTVNRRELSEELPHHRSMHCHAYRQE
jgi:hypothetical protein